jgi:hypothetical protein
VNWNNAERAQFSVVEGNYYVEQQFRVALPQRFPSFRRVLLSFNPIARKNWFRTFGVIIGILATCGFGINAHAADTVQAGAVAPRFTLPSQEDKPVSHTDYKGKWVGLYFYPKDQTKGLHS